MFDRLLSNWPKWIVFLLCAALVMLTGLADYFTGEEYAWSIFYLPAIALAAWHIGERAGVLVALFSAMAWVLAEFYAGVVYTQSLIPLWNTAVRFGFFLVTTFLVSEVRSKLELAESLAMTDALTTVANARRFYLLVEAELARARRHGTPISIAYLDLDNFKHVNDTRGHNEGDRALRLVASTMTRHLRESDLLARLGGDEFSVLFPETGREAADQVLSRLRTSLLRAMNDAGYPITFSIGAITFAQPPASVEAMIREADDLMYAVKRAGKNEMRHEVVEGSLP